jgi:hypothetical protein
MTKWQTSGASCAYTSDSEQHLAKSITSDALAANETMRQSSDFAQNIIAVTREFMGLEPKDLRNTTA